MKMVMAVSAWIETEYELGGKIDLLPLIVRIEMRSRKTAIRARIMVKDEAGEWAPYKLTEWHRRKELKQWDMRHMDEQAQRVCDNILVAAERNDSQSFWGSMDLGQ